MAAARKKQAPEPVEEKPAAVSWADVELATEVFWPGIGGKVVHQIIEWNEKLFDGVLEPMPIVLSRMSSVHGHWFPAVDKSVSQVRGYDEGAYLLHPAGYQPPQPLTSVRRSDLLRGMIFRHLTEQQLETRTNREPWCREVMRIHCLLTDKQIWTSPQTERRVEMAPTMPDGSKGVSRSVLVRDQPACPKTGAASIPKHLIASWPLGTLDLGEIVREET